MLSDFNSETVEISITDMSGRLVYFETVDIPATGTPITISSRDFKPGLYNVSLSNGFNKVHKRCVITYAN
ncbi:MAG: T9SS type A sorting domain-containing protein [Bacteroidia bacterium]